MKNLTIISISLCLILSLGSLSCSTTKLAGEDLNKIANLKPEEGKALVYFVRPSNFGGAIKFRVSCDDVSIGSTTGKRFIYAQLDPGSHLFKSNAENEAELNMDLESGKTYFVLQVVKMGIIMARNDLELISEPEGRSKLKKCKLSGDCPAFKVKE